MVAALGALVVGAGMASAAIQAPDGSLRGCVKSGTIRIVDQSEKCKDAELAITLLTGADNQISSAMVKDGTLTADDLSSAFKDSVLSADSSIDWHQLTDVPNGFADGTDDVDGGVAGDVNCAGCLTADDIAPRTITGANVANGTLAGGDDTATANEIKDGTVTASDLGGGAVGAGELQDGAVSTDKQRANAQTGVNGGLGTVVEVAGREPTESDLADVTLTPAGGGAADHLVLLTGQFEASWEDGSDPVIIEWKIMDGTRSVGPAYRIVLAQGQVTTGSVSFVDAQASEGVARTYSLHVRMDASGPLATGRVRFVDAALSAVDLGRK